MECHSFLIFGSKSSLFESISTIFCFPILPQKQNKVCVRFGEKTLQAKCSAVSPLLKQTVKETQRMQTFLSQSLCKSPIDFAIPQISHGKITEIHSIDDILQSAQKGQKMSTIFNAKHQTLNSGNSIICNDFFVKFASARADSQH